ncbi:hypothetical protein VNO77_23884 [Canavalia gladiata]|uniref:Uncharacterized protein n=1 Tax=Canavalia gladiata TaxID=3824 RepID=A0AAN9L8L5_CANGL
MAEGIGGDVIGEGKKGGEPKDTTFCSLDSGNLANNNNNNNNNKTHPLYSKPRLGLEKFSFGGASPRAPSFEDHTSKADTH